MKVYLLQFIKLNSDGYIENIYLNKSCFFDYESAKFYGELGKAHREADIFHILEFEGEKCYNGLNGEIIDDKPT